MYSECRHILPSGCKCHSPALRGQPYCYFHVRLHRHCDNPSPAASAAFTIEDTRGIQLALTQVLTALNSPYMDTRRAGLMLYGLQIASQLTTQLSKTKSDEPVRVCEETDGVSLAPPKEVCEPAIDCAACPRRLTCPDHQQPPEQQQPENTGQPATRGDYALMSTPSTSFELQGLRREMPCATDRTPNAKSFPPPA